MAYRKRSRILALIGVLLLLAGIAAAFLGPVEMYCYYLFSEGGRFAYEGFGFGSFMFGNLTVQIAGYYLIAVLFIPLGYGHLRLRRWARLMALALLWSWVIVGIPLMIVFLGILFSSKSLSLPVALLVIVLVAVSYPLLVGLFIRFYQGENVRRTFEAADPGSYGIERLPMPVLVLGCLFIFYTLILHIPILFNGLFPLLGVWLTGLEGIVALALSVLCSALLIWGVFQQKSWAWWGMVVFWGLLTASLLVTLVSSTWLQLLVLANFPPFEVGFLDGIPAKGYHLAAFLCLPLIATLGLLLASKGCFGVAKGSATSASPGSKEDSSPAPA